MEFLVFKTTKTSDALKTRMVSQWLNSSKSLADFAQEKNISPEVFSGWVAKYRKKASIKGKASGSACSDAITLVKIDLRKAAVSDCDALEE